MQGPVVEDDDAGAQEDFEHAQLGGDGARLAQEDGGRVEARQTKVVAGPVRGLDGEGPLDGQQGAEEDGHPEQPGGGARQNAAVGIEGEGEQHEDEQGKGRHLIGRHP